MGRTETTKNNRICYLIVALVVAIILAALLPGQLINAKTRKAPDEKPSEGNVFVVFTGTFKTDERQNALDRINEIRLEACREGIINPSTGKKLTEKDYVPIKWSSDLERIAQTRAAEADIYWAHTRPNEKSCFTINYNGNQSWGEVLAWNYNGNMVDGVNQWYEEKNDWVNETGGVTGHYTQMIDPKNKYVGLGAFVIKGEKYICISGEYSSYNGLEEKFVGVTGEYDQVIEIPASKLKANLKGATVKKGKTKKLSLTLGFVNEDSWLSGDYIQCTAYKKIKWSTSDKTIATISSKGKLTGKKAGTVTITAKTADGIKVKCTVKVK